MSSSFRHQRILNIVAAAIGAFGFFGFAYLAMHQGHFHEDAYILFKYVNNFVAGNGISFSPDLGPAEGATDFLWLMFLSLLHFVGLSVGLAAITMNTVGVFITLLLLNVLSDGCSRLLKLGLIILTWTLLLNNLTYAAAGGFSVWAYSAILVCLIVLFLKGPHERWFWVPMLSLILGLFRPDGLIIGVVFTLIAGSVLLVKKHNIKSFIIASSASFVVGLVYFIWRLNYFDSLLPLPLLVKSETSHVFEGWGQNWAWVGANSAIVMSSLLVLLALLFALKGSQCHTKRNVGVGTVLLSTLPFLAHLVAIGFAHQSQNVGYRFQAPELLFLYAILLFGLSYFFQQLSKPWLPLALTVLLSTSLAVSGISNTRQNFRYLAARNYINVLPLWLNEQLPTNSLLAVTEAGRLPFWASRHRFVDLVGLNTREVAVDGLSLTYLEQQNPDVLFIWFDAGDYQQTAVELSGMRLADLNQSRKLELSGTTLTSVERASVIAADYIVESNLYDIIAVRYWNSHNHLFAFKKGLMDSELFKRKVQEFTQAEYDFSYIEMQKIVDNGDIFEALYAPK